MTLLSVKALGLRFPQDEAFKLKDFSLDIARGESVALVGESGSGKTQAALAIMGLSSADCEVSGSIEFDGQELTGVGEPIWRKIRARRVAMVFQDPSSALNPYRRIGDQLRMVLQAHGLATGRAGLRRVHEVLSLVGLPDPEQQARAFPHELSGGMRQRAMIAAALIAEPELLIADEPTTAIDTTIQAQILRLLARLREQTGVAQLLISHDLGVVAGHCERLVVLHEGRIIERGSTDDVFRAPKHEQTQTMLAAVREQQSLVDAIARDKSETVLSVHDLSVSYRRGGETLSAVKPVAFDLREGETLAIAGESGSGKTSLIRAVLGLIHANGGTVSVLGNALPTELRARSRQELRAMQLVFQDPLGSLDPAMRIAESLAEPLLVHQPTTAPRERAAKLEAALLRVGIEASLLERYPHQLSGGEAQRVAIARALILEPQVLICDEAVASLDSHVRGVVMQLLADEQRRTGLAIVFISHDLQVVRRLSHRVMVMYLGRVFEQAETHELFRRPLHPYTRALIDAMPGVTVAQRDQETPLQGEIASLSRPPAGCVFHPRCRFAEAQCRRERPELKLAGGSEVACHRFAELDLSAGQGGDQPQTWQEA